jgi:hypothetical protein
VVAYVRTVKTASRPRCRPYGQHGGSRQIEHLGLLKLNLGAVDAGYLLRLRERRKAPRPNG